MTNLPSRPLSKSFKTRLCVRFRSGCCPNGDICYFAHGIEELRGPFGNGDRRARFVGEGRNASTKCIQIFPNDGIFPGDERKMHKDKVCQKFYNREVCPYGDKCSFPHLELGSLKDNPSFWKTKLCHRWPTSGRCPFGDRCSYAHGDAEMRKRGGGLVDLDDKDVVAAPSKVSPVSADAFLSKAKTKTKPCTAPQAQPKIRSLTLKRTNRIYGDWIDDQVQSSLFNIT